MRSTELKNTPDRGEGGFALALVLLALLGLTALATAGYLRSNTDYRINQNHRASMKAFYVADAARSEYMGRGKLRDDTVSYTYTDGTAQVWVDTLLAVDDSSTLYRLTTVGSHTSPEGGQANRQARSILLHKAAAISVNAAVTAIGGLVKNGQSGTVDGTDTAPSGSCPVAQSENVAGLEVPPGGYSQPSAGKGSNTWGDGFGGSPAIDSTSTDTQLLNDLGIDWQSILDGSFAEFDYVVSQDGYPSFVTDVDTDEWPMIFIDSPSYSVDDSFSGRGTLIFEGTGLFNGDFRWEGVILLGNQFVSNGNQDIDGAIIAGLNLELGVIPQPVDLGNGTWSINYNSCNVLNALKGIGWPVEEPSSWHEVF